MSVGHDDREFVSAKARDIIRAAGERAQSIRDLAQKSLTSITQMSEVAIDADHACDHQVTGLDCNTSCQQCAEQFRRAA